MRVISGLARGSRLETPKGLNTRPTTDRVKENIFNLIQFSIPNARVLDLFAGSGAMGIEALSRGASSLISVDASTDCAKIIKSNLIKAGLYENVKIVNKKVESFFKQAEIMECHKFDIIFADPPYGRKIGDYVLEMVDTLSILANDGIIVLEHAKDDMISFVSNNITLRTQKKYGNTIVSIYGRVE